MIMLSPSLEGCAQRHTPGADILALIGRTLGYEANGTIPRLLSGSVASCLARADHP